MKNLWYLFLVVLTTLLLLVSCTQSVASDKEAIEQVIVGYVSSYNANNFGETINYLTGYNDRDDAIAYLAFLKSMSGNITIVNFDKDAIAVTGNTAKVPVDFIIQEEVSFQWINLVKEQGYWRILWEQ